MSSPPDLSAVENRPRLGGGSLLALGINGIVGVGIFFTPNVIAGLAPGVSGAFVYLATAALLLPVALTVSMLGQSLPVDGAPSVWARAAFGEITGYAVGWIAAVSALISTAAVLLGFGTHVAAAFGYSDPGSSLIFACCTIAVLGSIAALGLRPSAWTWSTLTLLKLMPLGLLILLFVFATPAEMPQAEAVVEPEYGRALLVALFGGDVFARVVAIGTNVSAVGVAFGMMVMTPALPLCARDRSRSRCLARARGRTWSAARRVGLDRDQCFRAGVLDEDGRNPAGPLERGRLGPIRGGSSIPASPGGRASKQSLDGRCDPGAPGLWRGFLARQGHFCSGARDTRRRTRVGWLALGRPARRPASRYDALKPMSPTPLFDTHCHLDAQYFPDGAEPVLARARAAGVGYFVCIGVGGAEAMQGAVALAETYPNIWATVGVHPHDAARFDEALEQTLLRLIVHPRVVALGEVGLDHHYDHAPRDLQREVFERSIELARRFEKPLVIHTRSAPAETLEVLSQAGASGVGGIIHCFSEDRAFARRALDLGFDLSFSGIVTFKNATAIQDVAAWAPADRILLETDSPYLAPVPLRGKPCEPAYVAHTARRIAELRGVPLSDLCISTTQNAARRFRVTLDPLAHLEA